MQMIIKPNRDQSIRSFMFVHVLLLGLEIQLEKRFNKLYTFPV